MRRPLVSRLSVMVVSRINTNSPETLYTDTVSLVHPSGPRALMDLVSVMSPRREVPVPHQSLRSTLQPLWYSNITITNEGLVVPNPGPR